MSLIKVNISIMVCLNYKHNRIILINFQNAIEIFLKRKTFVRLLHSQFEEIYPNGIIVAKKRSNIIVRHSSTKIMRDIFIVQARTTLIYEGV